MFSFPTIEAETGIPLTKFDVPLTDWIGFRFGDATTQTAGVALQNLGTELTDTSELLSPIEANRRYGVEGEGGLHFDAPIREHTAELRRNRKERELLNAAIMESAAHPTGGVKSISGFVASVLGSSSHPLDFAMNLIPFVGSQSKAALVAKAGGGAFKTRIARGLLVSEEQLARLVRYPRLTGAVIDATAGNAIAEIPVAFQNYRDQRVYGLEDSFINIAAGGLFAAGIKGVARAFGIAHEIHSKLNDSTKDANLKTGFNQMARDEDVNIVPIIKLDENRLREEVRFDEVAARAEAVVAVKGTFQERFPVGSEVEFTPPGSISGKQTESGTVVGYRQDPTTGEWFAEIKSPVGTFNDFAGDINNIRQKPVDVSKLSEQDRTQYKQWLAATEKVRQRDNARVQKKLEEKRQQRVNELVEVKRKEWNEEERYKAAKEREVARQQAQGRIMSDEEVKARQTKATIEASDVAALNEDVASLTQRTAQKPEGQPEAMFHVEQAYLKQEMKPQTKAVDAALQCLLENL